MRRGKRPTQTPAGKKSALGSGLGSKKQSQIIHFFATAQTEPIKLSNQVKKNQPKETASSTPTKKRPSPFKTRALATTSTSALNHEDNDVLQDVLGVSNRRNSIGTEDDVLMDVLGGPEKYAADADSPSLNDSIDTILQGLDDDFLDQAIFAIKRKKGPAAISSRRKKKPKTKPKYTLDTLLAEPKEQFNGADNDFIDELKSPTKEEKKQGYDEQNSMDEILKLGDKYGRDKVYVDVFTQWPRPLPVPVYSATGDPSADFMDCILAQGARTQEVMVKQGTISNYFVGRVCPDHIASWLFQVAAFSADVELAAGAFRNLQDIISPPGSWVPSYADFEHVFHSYGADSPIPEEKDDALDFSQELENNKAAPNKFPLINFTLVVRLISVCICNCPDRYQESQVCLLIEWVCRFLFDSHVEEAIITVEETLRHLIEYFSGERGSSMLWAEKMPRLCRLLSDPSLCSHHPNHMPILMSLPLTRPSNRLRSAFAFSLLSNEYRLRTVEHETEMIRQLSEMVASIKIGTDTDYSRLCTIISLMDSCLCSEECLAHRPVQHLPELRQNFDSLNHQIREVRGYNLMITKVKDLLTLLIAKIDLLLMMHKRRPVQVADLSRFWQI